MCDNPGMISGRHSNPILLRIDRWRGRLEDQLGGSPIELDPERCHEIRESLGRLAVWLLLADFPSLRERVKALRRALGALRDFDVFRERLESLDAARFEQERRRRCNALRRQLTGASTQALQRDLRDLPAVNYSAAESESARLARRVRKAGEAFAEKPTRQTAHRLRRRLRDYRFAREWLRLPTSALKPLIRRLGRLNDDTLVRTVARELGMPESVDSDIRAEHELKACLARWKSIRGEIRDWSRRSKEPDHGG